MHKVVHPPEFLDGDAKHVFHAGFDRYVDFDEHGAVFGMPSKVFALCCSFLGAIDVDVRKDNALDSGLGKGKRCFFTYA